MAQLKSSTVTGNLAVTGAIYADKIAKLGGTNSQILMADGSTLDKNSVGSGNVTGSGLTADKIILGNGSAAIKTSSYGIATSSTKLTATSDTELPTSKAVAAYVTGLGYTGNTGTVTSIAAGTGLSGGTITASGTIALANATQRTAADTSTHHLIYRDNGTGVMKYETGVYIGGELGELHATTFKIAEKATLVYDTAKSAVKFVFS